MRTTAVLTLILAAYIAPSMGAPLLKRQHVPFDSLDTAPDDDIPPPTHIDGFKVKARKFSFSQITKIPKEAKEFGHIAAEGANVIGNIFDIGTIIKGSHSTADSGDVTATAAAASATSTDVGSSASRRKLTMRKLKIPKVPNGLKKAGHVIGEGLDGLDTVFNIGNILHGSQSGDSDEAPAGSATVSAPAAATETAPAASAATPSRRGIVTLFERDLHELDERGFGSAIGKLVFKGAEDIFDAISGDSDNSDSSGNSDGSGNSNDDGSSTSKRQIKLPKHFVGIGPELPPKTFPLIFGTGDNLPTSSSSSSSPMSTGTIPPGNGLVDRALDELD